MGKGGGWLLGLVMVVGLLSGCLSERSRESALLPAARGAWVHVREDIERGVQAAQREGVNADDLARIRGLSDHMDTALEVGTSDALGQIFWPDLESYAFKGIDSRVQEGELTEMTASSLRQRVVNFADVLKMLTAPVTILRTSGRADSGREVPTGNSVWDQEAALCCEDN